MNLNNTNNKNRKSDSQIENISFSRSDGVKHDLVNLYSRLNVDPRTESDARRKSATEVTASNDSHEHEHIIINRSDHRAVDIRDLVKANAERQSAGDSPQHLDGKSSSPNITTKKSMTNIIDPKRSFSFSTMGRMSFNVLGDTFSKNIKPSPLQVSSKESVFSFHPTTVRIVHMSDTYTFLNSTYKKRNFLPHGDILVHSGNFTQEGTEKEFGEFDSWLASVKDIYHYRVVVLGNKDVRRFGLEWEVFRGLLPNATHVLCHSEAIILGIRFYGCPWHWGHKSNYSLKPSAPSTTSARFSDIPEGIDVLITHGPAAGRLDLSSDGEHWGSKELFDGLLRVKPGLHLHGHVSESRGFIHAMGHFPLTLNSCMCDKTAEVMYACPHVVKCTSSSYAASKATDMYSSSPSFSANRSSDSDRSESSQKLVWNFTLGFLE